MEECLKNLLNSKEKKVIMRKELVVKNFEINNYIDEIKVDLVDADIEYKSLFLKKGEIYPTPKINDILEVSELYLGYDEFYCIKLYISAKISGKKQTNFVENDLKKVLSFSRSSDQKNNFINNLKSLGKIKEELFSSLFSVCSIDEKYIKLYDLQDMDYYRLIIEKNEGININDLLLINNFIRDIQKKEIVFTNLSLFKKMNQSSFFYLVPRYIINSNVFKIVDEETNYYILVNDKKKLFKLEKNNIEYQLSQLIYIDKYVIKKFDEIFDLLILEKDSFIYSSGQDIYFESKLHINFLTVFAFYIHDLKDINVYDTVNIIDTKKTLKNKIEYVVALANIIPNYEYYPVELSLESQRDKNIKKKTFKFLVYQGLLNKINLFINYTSPEAYFYEFLFTNLYGNIGNVIKEILFEDNNFAKTIKIYDSFNSKNRKRINILNIPKQKIYNEKNEIIDIKSNSIQISEFVKDKEFLTLGVFNILDIELNDLVSNDIFDDYYDQFGNIINDYADNICRDEFINECKSKYENCALDKNEAILLKYFNETITLSQYKTRIGFLVCYFLYNDPKTCEDLELGLLSILSIFKRCKMNLFKKLRILFFYLRQIILSNNKNVYFHFLPNSKNIESDPYILAHNFNIDEIKNLDEFSRLFFAYLQLDSFILFNYYINQTTYSFSLEPLHIMKYHLLQNYDEFYFIIRNSSDKYAYQTCDEKITVINEKTLFGNRINYFSKKIECKTLEESKNYALSISMENRHERNSHQKRANKNKRKKSATYFCRDLEYFKIVKSEKEETLGESGRMVESFISPDSEFIEELKIQLIYGDLLNYKYFIGKDFKNLFNKVKEIQNQKNSLNSSQKREKNSKCFNAAYDKKKARKESEDSEREKYEAELKERYYKYGFIISGDVIYPKLSMGPNKIFDTSKIKVNPFIKPYYNK